MLRQIFEIAKTVVIASFRKNLLIASWLIMLPLLLAAWLFETSNPGFQSGFILDAGGGLMAILSVVLLAVLAFEHLFWPVEQPAPWFFFSRLKSRAIYLAGKFIGISFILFSSLLDFSLLLFLIIGITSGTWLVLPFKIALMVWAEYSLLLAVFVLLSTFLSRLMSVGMMIPVFFVAHSINYLKTGFANPLTDILLSILPNAGLFQNVIENGDWLNLLTATGYSILLSAFYIALSGIVLNRRDL